jgi:hypothetical protein
VSDACGGLAGAGACSSRTLWLLPGSDTPCSARPLTHRTDPPSVARSAWLRFPSVLRSLQSLFFLSPLSSLPPFPHDVRRASGGVG